MTDGASTPTPTGRAPEREHSILTLLSEGVGFGSEDWTDGGRQS